MPDYVLQFVLELSLPVLTALSTWAVAEVIHLVRTKVKNEQVSAAFERAIHVTETVTDEVGQAFVAKLKERSSDGRLSKEDATQALFDAYTKAKSHLGPRGIADLKRILGTGTDQDVQAYLIGLIEARVAATGPKTIRAVQPKAGQ